MSKGLKRPCGDCPFLRGSDFETSMVRGRAQDIADGLRGGGEFACHKTTGVRGGSGNPRDRRFCAGALGTMENEGTAVENQMFRIGVRLGLIEDPEDAEWLGEVYDSLDDWVDVHPDRR